MPEKPPFYEQAYEFSCVPACLRMVLAAHGHEISETELRARCECEEDGTSAIRAVQAAVQLGFTQTIRAFLQLEELPAELARGLYPIAFIDFPDGNTHAVVVIAVSHAEVTVLDPARPPDGARVFALEEFNQRWSLKQGLTILVD